MDMLITMLAHGGHPWLVGAAQPMASLDHFLAGLFVAVVVGIGLASVANRAQRLDTRPKP